MLELKIEETAFGRPFAFAKYGEQATGHVYCLEVFEYRDALPSPGDALLFLVCHDYRPSRLIRYEIEEQKGTLFLNIQREFVDARNGRAVSNIYAYRYNSERGFLRTMSDIYSPAQ